ncbi:hypothetical protein [Bacteroides graminisolvens]
MRLASCFNEEVGHPSLPPSLLNVSIEVWNDDPRIASVKPDDANGVSAYFLPWGADTGNYMDLPNNTNGRNLFLTAELSGCYVGVQVTNNGFRVRHYNFQNPITDVSDFKRYNNTQQTHWLVPVNDHNRALFDNSLIPHSFYAYNLNAPAVFWGENTANSWTFYYQVPNDPTVYTFV